MPASPQLTIHRAADEIGGNCIEIAFDGHRVLLDAGSPLAAPEGVDPGRAFPATLGVTKAPDAGVISHPHQDHFGLLRGLPLDWPVWSGAAAEILMRLTASVAGEMLGQRFSTFRSGVPFHVGPFTITPYLTDHSAFDAHMLLVEVGGRRILYTGDFRRLGRKAALVDRFMASPPADVDLLLMEGTTLGRAEAFPTEDELEERFVDLFRATPGRVFVTWSAQNIDRTVTIYRSCKRSGRRLVLDLYTVDVLERLSALRDSLPRLGWAGISVVITASMARMYRSTRRVNHPEFVDRCAASGHALGAAALRSARDSVVMLRPSLFRDFSAKGMLPTRDDTWVFSMWSGYRDRPEYGPVRAAFSAAGARIEHIHTSGHASRDDLVAFAGRVAPRHLVPIHSFTWDQHLDGFSNVLRLRDGEAHALV